VYDHGKGSLITLHLSACGIVEQIHANIFSLISSCTLGICRRTNFMEK
jgi:hypothetical protein